ncbi:MAG: hypothetical protein AAFR88_11980, partial [Pseudomonadota bacterium]
VIDNFAGGSGAIAVLFEATGVVRDALIKRGFDAVGFSLQAMQYKRSEKALLALRRFNGLSDSMPEPFGWRFHPNKWCSENWQTMYPDRCYS